MNKEYTCKLCGKKIEIKAPRNLRGHNCESLVMEAMNGICPWCDDAPSVEECWLEIKGFGKMEFGGVEQ
jgi:DNA-directed RNA polymerase subunit RPC12/RpoP